MSSLIVNFTLTSPDFGGCLFVHIFWDWVPFRLGYLIGETSMM